VVSNKGGPNGKPAWKRYEQDAQAISRSDLGVVLAQFVELVGLNADQIWWGMTKISGGASRPKLDLVVPWYHQLRDYLSLIDTAPGTLEMVRKPDHVHSRLAFIPDKGGKDRVIAMGDVYSQTLLKPIHDFIFRILERVPEDGTHDQDSVREQVRE